MSNFQKGKKLGSDVRAKAIKGYKRVTAFAHATALAVLVTFAGNHLLSELRSGDRDVATCVLTLSTVLIGLTALTLYVKFFTEDN